MPEGPEIKRIVDSLDAVLTGNYIDEIKFSFPHLKRYETLLSSRKVTSVATRGKAILTAFDNGWNLFTHNQLYGRWLITTPEEIPITNRKLRVSLKAGNHIALLYSASTIEVLHDTDLQNNCFLSSLGPEVLSGEISAGTIVKRLQSKKFRNRRISNLLIDQKFVAGIGTYLCAEILFFARLHPGTKPSKCNNHQLWSLASQILKLTRRSYVTGGITNPPYLVKRLQKKGKTLREEHRFSVYRRASERCYVCSSRIYRSNVGGRPMFHCPCCQAQG